MAATDDARSAAQEAYDEAEPWVEKLARFGYAAKGAVYILVGGLAAASALGAGGETTGSSGAMGAISGSTAGRAMLAAIAVGLIGYAVWGVVRATSNPENDSGWSRAYYVLSALIHGSLAVEAARLALNGGAGSSAGTESDSASHWSQTVMQQPFGHWLLGGAGIGVAAFGIGQLVNAWRIDLDDQLDLSSMSASARTWAVRIARFGLAARGVVFAIIGAYLVVAAAQSEPSEARGINDVLDLLGRTPWLLALIAFGLMAHGVYNMVRARYRVIRT